MLREIKTIDRQNLPVLIQFIEQHRNNIDLLIDDIGELKIDNGIGTKFYTPYNPIFKSIAVSTEQEEIKYVSLIGHFDLCFSDLIHLFNEFREIYVSRDELFFYFFNEKSSPVVSVTSPSQIDENTIVKNLQFRW